MASTVALTDDQINALPDALTDEQINALPDASTKNTSKPQSYLEGVAQPFVDYGKNIVSTAKQLITPPEKQTEPAIAGAIRSMQAGPAVDLAGQAVYGAPVALAKSAYHAIVPKGIRAPIHEAVAGALAPIAKGIQNYEQEHPYVQAGLETAGAAANLIPIDRVAGTIGDALKAKGAANISRDISQKVSDAVLSHAGQNAEEGTKNVVNTITENGLQGSIKRIRENVQNELNATKQARDLVQDHELNKLDKSTLEDWATPNPGDQSIIPSVSTHKIFDGYAELIEKTGEGLPAEQKANAVKFINNLKDEYTKEGLIDEFGTPLIKISDLKDRLAETGGFNKGSANIDEEAMKKRVADNLYLKLKDVTDKHLPVTGLHNDAIHNLINAKNVVEKLYRSTIKSPPKRITPADIIGHLGVPGIAGGVVLAGHTAALGPAAIVAGLGALGYGAGKKILGSTKLGSGPIAKTLQVLSLKKSTPNLTKTMKSFKGLPIYERKQKLINRMKGLHPEVGEANPKVPPTGYVLSKNRINKTKENKQLIESKQELQNLIDELKERPRLPAPSSEKTAIPLGENLSPRRPGTYTYPGNPPETKITESIVNPKSTPKSGLKQVVERINPIITVGNISKISGMYFKNPEKINIPGKGSFTIGKDPIAEKNTWYAVDEKGKPAAMGISKENIINFIKNRPKEPMPMEIPKPGQSPEDKWIDFMRRNAGSAGSESGPVPHNTEEDKWINFAKQTPGQQKEPYISQPLSQQEAEGVKSSIRKRLKKMGYSDKDIDNMSNKTTQNIIDKLKKKVNNPQEMGYIEDYNNEQELRDEYLGIKQKNVNGYNVKAELDIPKHVDRIIDRATSQFRKIDPDRKAVYQIEYGPIKASPGNYGVLAHFDPSSKSIKLNSEVFHDEDKLTETVNLCKDLQLNPKGTNNLDGILNHEFGHGLFLNVSDDDFEQITTHFMEACGVNWVGLQQHMGGIPHPSLIEDFLKGNPEYFSNLKSNVSNYVGSCLNRKGVLNALHEFSATAYMEYKTAANPRGYAKTVGKLLEGK